MSVVIVDDHAGFRMLARRMLEGDGFDVIGEAATGVEGLAVVTALRPAVVVLDVRLPDSDGFAVTERLRASGVDSRVVLVSTRQARDFGDHPVRCGADGFLAKSELSGATLRATAGLP